MTVGARELLLKLYSMKNDDDIIDAQSFYEEGKQKTFEKYAFQLKDLGFVELFFGSDEIDMLILTTKGIEAVEDEPGSRFTDLMNPIPNEIDIEQLEEIFNKAISKASKEDKQKLARVLADMQKHAAGERINWGKLINDLFAFGNNLLPIIKAVIAYLSSDRI